MSPFLFLHKLFKIKNPAIKKRHKLNGNVRGKDETEGVPLSNYEAAMLDILEGKKRKIRK